MSPHTGSDLHLRLEVMLLSSLKELQFIFSDSTLGNKKSGSKILPKRFGSTDFWLVVDEASLPVELGRRLRFTGHKRLHQSLV